MEFDFSGRKVSIEEARIVAHVCGDGYFCVYTGRRSKKELLTHLRKNPYRTIYQIGYCNTEPALLKQFSNDIFVAFQRKTQMQKGNTVVLRSKPVYNRIKSLGGGNSRSWFVGKAIFDSPVEIICEWLKAFFDDEAYVETKKKRICLNSVNKHGLLDVEKLLHKVGVADIRFYGPYVWHECVSYRITILKNSLKFFSDLVGFNHPKKSAQMKALLEAQK